MHWSVYLCEPDPKYYYKDSLWPSSTVHPDAWNRKVENLDSKRSWICIWSRTLDKVILVDTKTILSGMFSLIVQGLKKYLAEIMAPNIKPWLSLRVAAVGSWCHCAWALWTAVPVGSGVGTGWSTALIWWNMHIRIHSCTAHGIEINILPAVMWGCILITVWLLQQSPLKETVLYFAVPLC